MKSSNTMYDFYGKPPKTRKELKEWLTTWLQPTNDDKEYTIKNEKYMNELSFKRAFNIHSVFRNVTTNEYKWYVVPDTCFVDDFEKFPKKRYSSYESLIDGLVEYYYKFWQLSG